MTDGDRERPGTEGTKRITTIVAMIVVVALGLLAASLIVLAIVEVWRLIL